MWVRWAAAVGVLVWTPEGDRLTHLVTGRGHHRLLGWAGCFSCLKGWVRMCFLRVVGLPRKGTEGCMHSSFSKYASHVSHSPTLGGSERLDSRSSSLRRQYPSPGNQRSEEGAFSVPSSPFPSFAQIPRECDIQDMFSASSNTDFFSLLQCWIICLCFLDYSFPHCTGSKASVLHMGLTSSDILGGLDFSHHDPAVTLSVPMS